MIELILLWNSTRQSQELESHKKNWLWIETWHQLCCFLCLEFENHSFKNSKTFLCYSNSKHPTVQKNRAQRQASATGNVLIINPLLPTDLLSDITPVSHAQAWHNGCHGLSWSQPPRCLSEEKTGRLVFEWMHLHRGSSSLIHTALCWWVSTRFQRGWSH